MNMYLTIEEQKKLEKKLPVENLKRDFPTCSKGHELMLLCFRRRSKPIRVTRIKNIFYCPTCQTIFHPTMSEIKP